MRTTLKAFPHSHGGHPKLERNLMKTMNALSRKTLLLLGLATVALTALPNTARAQTTTIFDFTGTNQFFVVPTGVTSLSVSMWGAGGGKSGGSGAFVSGLLTVTPGETLTLIVGGGGGFSTGSTGNAFGGGGEGRGSVGVFTINSGGGGGRSGIRDSGNTEVVTAGGGGGGGNSTNGAAGGLAVGNSSEGGGGTQSAGGAGSGPVAPSRAEMRRVWRVVVGVASSVVVREPLLAVAVAVRR